MSELFTKIQVPMRTLIALLLASAVIAMVVVGVRSTSVAAGHCYANYFGTIYDRDGFFDGRCPNINNFPNTGPPFAPGLDGNSDSVGYVIPRTSKDFSTASEALAGVGDKMSFYNRLKYHYDVRGWGQGNWWAKDGAAFVVFSLIGKTPPADRNLTNADWDDLLARLNNPNLTMSLDNAYPLSPNSAAVHDTTGKLDFFHFYNSAGETGPSFVFRLNGAVIGSIERKCANLMGVFALPQANQWTINGQSYVDNTADATARQQGNPALSASPGDLLNWDHDLRNNGPNNMERTVYYNVDRLGYGNGWDAIKAPTGNASGGTGSLFVNFGGGSGAANTAYRVVPSDGGRTLCQRISWIDSAWNNAGWGSSAWACAVVPFNYNLTPSVSGVSGVGTVGGFISTVTPRVTNEIVGNAGATTDSPPVEWQLNRVEVPPTVPDPNAIPLTQQENGNAPCAHYGNGGVNDCIPKGGGTRTFPATPVALAALNGERVDPDTAVGTRICYTLSVRPYSQANGNWRHSAPVCLTVSKQPKVQIWGGDLRTRGNIETWTTSIDEAGAPRIFGSWVEYGGFSVGGNDKFASAAGLNNGTTNTAASEWNKLTFANIDNSGSDSYGMYTLDPLPKITDQFIGAASAGVFAGGSLNSLNSGKYTAGSVTIGASAIGQVAGVGKSIVIVSTGTVTINGDITYTGAAGDTFTSVAQLPQVVIIARDINITGGVGRIDAWLLTTMAGGAINTCSDRPVTEPLNSNNCNNALTVNGPVVTQHLHLRRTAGSDTVATAGSPAEVFNLRPDAYIWAYARASQSGKAQTVYSVELPPRF